MVRRRPEARFEKTTFVEADVGEDDLARLGQQVEESIWAAGWAEVPAHEVGLAILGPLRELDSVAYLRFASVYKAFDSAADFEVFLAQRRASLAQEINTFLGLGGTPLG